MTIDELTKKVAEFEGFSHLPYKCQSGVWTIGYGRTEGVSSTTPSTTKEKEYKWLEDKLHDIYLAISNSYNERFNLNQRLALTSFYFNCGRSNFLKLIDYGRRTDKEISEKITAYNKGNGKVLAGLVKRRAWEKSLFDKPMEGRHETVVGFKYAGFWWYHTGLSTIKDEKSYLVMRRLAYNVEYGIYPTEEELDILEETVVNKELPMQIFALG